MVGVLNIHGIMFAYNVPAHSDTKMTRHSVSSLGLMTRD